jgi:arylsulfatase A-like enzyme
VDAPVGTRRIAATVLDLAGITATAIPGPSLAATWSGPEQREVARAQMEASEDADEFAPASRGAMRSVLDRRWHYIIEGDGSEELYAYRSDPEERVNLVRGGRADTALVRMRGLARAMP